MTEIGVIKGDTTKLEVDSIIEIYKRILNQ